MTALRQHLAQQRALCARCTHDDGCSECIQPPPPLNREEVMGRVEAGVALLKWIAAVFAAVCLAAAWRT